MVDTPFGACRMSRGRGRRRRATWVGSPPSFKRACETQRRDAEAGARPGSGLDLGAELDERLAEAPCCEFRHAALADQVDGVALFHLEEVVQVAGDVCDLGGVFSKVFLIDPFRERRRASALLGRRRRGYWRRRRGDGRGGDGRGHVLGRLWRRGELRVDNRRPRPDAGDVLVGDGNALHLEQRLARAGELGRRSRLLVHGLEFSQQLVEPRLLLCALGELQLLQQLAAAVDAVDGARGGELKSGDVGELARAAGSRHHVVRRRQSVVQRRGVNVRRHGLVRNLRARLFAFVQRH
mmetsp:Transcript_15002/g.50330  ORF Transcript_15002/g.50330 Transcript_15002/m.50330 type:complete len:295 (-) Transcript_15002:3528-4412(-)